MAFTAAEVPAPKGRHFGGEPYPDPSHGRSTRLDQQHAVVVAVVMVSNLSLDSGI
ncbi:hypothetical protein ACH4VR_28075 [Streptomyces sp. NPDC020883]|uniref:hypothetical protein n=1 Tax=Streptomyces sp. NPDC020883 TaxID=3365099 RepID=UPI0037BDDB57